MRKDRVADLPLCSSPAWRNSEDDIVPVKEELHRMPSSISRISYSTTSCSDASSQRGTINEHEDKWVVSASGMQIRSTIVIKKRQPLHGSSRATAPVISSLSTGDLHAQYTSNEEEAEQSPAQITKGLLRKWAGVKGSKDKEKAEKQTRQTSGHVGGSRGGWIKKITPDEKQQEKGV